MNLAEGARRLTVWVALGAWLYCWYLIRGLRHAYSQGPAHLGVMPSWLLVLMVAASSSLLGAAVCAGMRVPAWRALAVAGGAGLLALTVLGQFAVMNSAATADVSLARALNEALESRGPLATAVFIAGLPTLLVLAGLTGLLWERMAVPSEEPGKL